MPDNKKVIFFTADFKTSKFSLKSFSTMKGIEHDEKRYQKRIGNGYVEGKTTDAVGTGKTIFEWISEQVKN